MFDETRPKMLNADLFIILASRTGSFFPRKGRHSGVALLMFSQNGCFSGMSQSREVKRWRSDFEEITAAGCVP